MLTEWSEIGSFKNSKPKTHLERFQTKTKINIATGCIEWIAYIGTGGYGRFGLNGKIHTAHRVAFYLQYGRWPKDCLLHKCDNPKCVNLKHLFEGSPKDNNQDRKRKGRNGKVDFSGIKHPRSRLTENQIIQIRQFSKVGATYAELSRIYKVSDVMIKYIVKGERWKHI